MSEPEKPHTVIVGVGSTSKSPTALVWGTAEPGRETSSSPD
jgi:hypothetical protein